MSEHRTIRDCRYCFATWPILADDADYHDDPRTGDLARAIAQTVHEREDVSDAIIGQFMEDAAAIVGDFHYDENTWTITEWTNHIDTGYDPDGFHGVDFTFKLNGIDYVVPSSDMEPAYPVSLREFRKEEVPGE